MSILPFRCRAFAVKPRPAYSKSRMDSRAWIGMNLGRSWLSPGAYNVWVPSAGKVVTTSDVYFNESFYPWRPDSEAASAIAQRTDGDAAQLPGLPTVEAPRVLPAKNDFDGPQHLLSNEPAATRSRRALLLFSGPIHRRDGIAAFLSRFSYAADSVDNDPCTGGGSAHNLLDNAVYEQLLHRCAGGYYSAVLASPPCSTFTVSRFFASPSAKDGGPPPVRDRDNVMGLPD
eukprot:4365066-Pleurochrysis_carterae.AAC.1